MIVTSLLLAGIIRNSMVNKKKKAKKNLKNASTTNQMLDQHRKEINREPALIIMTCRSIYHLLLLVSMS